MVVHRARTRLPGRSSGARARPALNSPLRLRLDHPGVGVWLCILWKSGMDAMAKLLSGTPADQCQQRRIRSHLAGLWVFVAVHRRYAVGWPRGLYAGLVRLEAAIAGSGLVLADRCRNRRDRAG